MKNNIIISILVFILSFFIFIFLFRTCKEEKEIKKIIDTLEIYILQTDTIEIADSSIISTEENIRNRIKINFFVNDSNIFIQGFCLTNPAYTNIKYHLKPKSFKFEVEDGHFTQISDTTTYQVEISNIKPVVIRKPKNSFFISAGGGYTPQKFISCISIGYKYKDIGVAIGIAGEAVTGSFFYFF